MSVDIKDITKINNSETKSFNKIKSENIYHFTKMKTVIEHILPDRKLRLNPITKTNDPRESKQRPYTVTNVNVLDLKSWGITDLTVFANLVKENIKTLCFSEDYFMADRWWRGYNLPRMWAQYGENHCGVCIGINKRKFGDANKEIFDRSYFESVIYKLVEGKPYEGNYFINQEKIDKKGLKLYISEYRKKYYKHLFFTKHIDWESEREIRVIYEGNELIEEYMDIKDSISRIILGIDFNLKYLPSIVNLAKDIPIEIIDYSNGQLTTRYFRPEYIMGLMKY